MSVVTRREALRAIALGVAGAPAVLRGRYQLFAQSNAQYSARAVRLVESSVVVDLLNQFQFQDFADRPPKIDQWLTRPGSFTHTSSTSGSSNTGVRGPKPRMR